MCHRSGYMCCHRHDSIIVLAPSDKGPDDFTVKLPAGFQKQNGNHDVFTEHSVHMDTHYLEKAPVHILATERSVGYINYELLARSQTA